MSVSRYVVATAVPEQDAEAIIAVWRQHHPGDPGARYRWMFDGDDRSWCLLLRTTDDTVVGTTGLVRRRFRCGDDYIDAGHTVDLVVHPDHRSAGPAIQLQRTLLGFASDRNIGLLYGAPVRAAEMIQRRVGFQVLDQLHRWRKSLRAAHDLPPQLSSTALRGVLGWFVDTVIRGYSGELTFPLQTRWSISIETDFDARFDDLWARAGGQFGVVGERTSAYLRWRFGPGAPREYRVFCLSRRDGVLAGYIVYSIRNNDAEIADLLFSDVRTLRALLTCFSRAMRREGRFHITLHGIEPAALSNALRRAGFFRRTQPSNVLIYLDEKLRGQRPELAQPDRWFLTDADRDI